jgi:hypothetical protein
VAAKLLKAGSENLPLSLYDETGLRIPIRPHLLYANAQFRSLKMGTDLKRLVDWSQSKLDKDWNEKRILNYLGENQEDFRVCLTWLVDGAIARGEFGAGAAQGDPLPDWRRKKEPTFLQLHGLTHCNVSIRPQIGPDQTDSGGWFFSGLDLGPSQAMDPLDMICWHLLYLLMRDGELDIRQCRRCRTFFTPQTERRIYCTDLCRAKAHSKTPEEWRTYMREYRKIRKRCTRPKKKTSELGKAEYPDRP